MMPIRPLLLTLSVILLCATMVKAQNKEPHLIQLSGVIISADSSEPVPFVNVIIKGKHTGTMSSFNGFFSLAVDLRDTIVFSAVGYKRTYTTIPDTCKQKSYSVVKIISPDNIMLKTAVIYDFPKLSQFKEVFLRTKVPDDGVEIAKKNLELAEKKANMELPSAEGSLTFKYQVQAKADKLYYNGQYAPIRLLDPIAWSKFIKALKNGELKIQH